MKFHTYFIDIKRFIKKKLLLSRKFSGSMLITAAVILAVVSSIPYHTYALEQHQRTLYALKDLLQTSTVLNVALRFAGVTSFAKPKSQNISIPIKPLFTRVGKFASRTEKLEVAVLPENGLPNVAKVAGVTSSIEPTSQDITEPYESQPPTEENIPSHIEEPEVQIPAQKGQTIGFISIHAEHVTVNAPIIEGANSNSYMYGVGHHIITSLPNEESGNVVLAGHRWLPDGNAYSRTFFDLPKIQIGETIEVFYRNKTYIYEVYGTEIVQPLDVHIADPTVTPELTIYTCHPWDSTTHRFVVHAKLIEAR